jgi:type IV pilus assembly protein PilW
VSAAAGCTTRATHLREHGFSLIELMVAVVVGMLGVLAIMSVYVSSEGQKRTTMGGADASENALIALVTLERDLRVAGLGIVGLGCTTVHGYNAALAPTDIQFAPLPVVITPATVSDKLGSVTSDTVSVIHSGSAFGSIPTTLAASLPTSISDLLLTNGDGIVAGDVLLVSGSSMPCALLQASANSVNTGTYWTVTHAAEPGFPFNRADDLLATIPGMPGTGYPAGSRVTNMGPMVRRQYFVQNGSLMMQDMNLPTNATNPVTLVEGVTSIHAMYGIDKTGDGYLDEYVDAAPAEAANLVAVQIAVVARGGELEKTLVTQSPLVLWAGGTVANGGAIALDATQQRYRYRVYKTIVPLRNVIWNNNP